jgi:hypothetical protein
MIGNIRSAEEWIELRPLLEKHINQHGRTVGELSRIFETPRTVMAAVVRSLDLQPISAQLAHEIQEKRKQRKNV